MKLKDILKTDTDNTGWLKTFKKLGADREMLQYVNNNITKEGGGDVNKKYGYYKISPDIFDVINEDRIELVSFIIEVSRFVANIELNGVTSFDKVGGIEGYVNISIQLVQQFFINEPNALPYCNRTYLKFGIKVDESDMNSSIITSNEKINYLYKGTLLERLKQIGAGDIPYFIPITKEEYENLSNDFKESEL